MILTKKLNKPALAVLTNKKLIIHTQPSKDKYLQIVEYKSGIVTPQAFANIEIEIDNLLLY